MSSTEHKKSENNSFLFTIFTLIMIYPELSERENLLLFLLLDPKLKKWEAGVKAGYTKASAKSEVAKALRKPVFKAALDKEFKKIQDSIKEQLILNETALLNELAYLATSNIADLYDENGHLKGISEMPLSVQKTIQTYEIEETGASSPKSTSKSKGTQIKRKIRQYDRLTAIRLYMQYYGMLKDVNIDARVDKLRDKTPDQIMKDVQDIITHKLNV